MAEETYYSLLEVSETATAAEIKSAYLRLIREVHPDRLANATAYWQRQAEEKAKEINEAYAILSNLEKRRLYDAQLTAYRGSQGTNRGTSTSQSSASYTANSSEQQSRTGPGSQSTSTSANQQTAKRPNTASQPYQGAQTSTSAPNEASHTSNTQQVSGFNSVQRFFFALGASIFAFGAAGMFWGSVSIGEGVFSFLLSAALSFGVVCLYQRQITKILLAVGVKRAKHRLWVTLGMIALVLLVGKLAYANFHSL
jgi:hypothetical protein